MVVTAVDRGGIARQGTPGIVGTNVLALGSQMAHICQALAQGLAWTEIECNDRVRSAAKFAKSKIFYKVLFRNIIYQVMLEKVTQGCLTHLNLRPPSEFSSTMTHAYFFPHYSLSSQRVSNRKGHVGTGNSPVFRLTCQMTTLLSPFEQTLRVLDP